jgi:hypothetical protein
LSEYELNYKFHGVKLNDNNLALRDMAIKWSPALENGVIKVWHLNMRLDFEMNPILTSPKVG